MIRVEVTVEEREGEVVVGLVKLPLLDPVTDVEAEYADSLMDSIVAQLESEMDDNPIWN